MATKKNSIGELYLLPHQYLFKQEIIVKHYAT